MTHKRPHDKRAGNGNTRWIPIDLDLDDWEMIEEAAAARGMQLGAYFSLTLRGACEDTRREYAGLEMLRLLRTMFGDEGV